MNIILVKPSLVRLCNKEQLSIIHQYYGGGAIKIYNQNSNIDDNTFTQKKISHNQQLA
ncbi:MAG: hypothetical protein MSS67_10520 [Helicobacter bilis]|uniref:hypothetical protein n=1 Tax=Helicobacter bilis TaxID=37372 RepID=UPI0026EC522E|nr:hypothetical protein [Helicobacter bilis]MCI7412105.1 hypothetical protein [Helicobacter bilis]